MSAFRDVDFQQKMLSFLVRDRNFLKRTSTLLEVADFKGRAGQGPELEWVAEVALDYWSKYGEPIGGMLRPMMQDYCRQQKTAQRMKDRVFELVDKLRHPDNLVAVEAVEKLIIEYKHRQARRQFLESLLQAQEKGQLSDERILHEVYDLTKKIGKNQKIIDYARTMDARVLRREKEKLNKFPFLFIDPLDAEIRTVPRGALALIIAKYKRGKSMLLVWIARAMALQNYNVLYFTLEDPLETVEDRLDAMMTGLPIRELGERAEELKKRFKRVREMLRGRIKIFDGTDGGMSVDRMEEIWERLRNQGFTADVVIIDYDDEIIPPKSYSDESGRRREFAEIYRRLRLFASRRQVYLWTAAQTKRGHEQQMIVSGDDVAEDISKVRKVAFCLGLGAGPADGSIYGEWGEDSRFLYVAAHKFDQMKIGWPIMGDFRNGLFYDSEATLRKLAEFAKAQAKKRKNGSRP